MTTSVREDMSLSVCHTIGIEGRGPLDAEVMVVGLNPAKEEMRTGKVYSGKTGKLLQAVMNACGTPMSECYLTNLFCWPYAAEKPKLEDARNCIPRLVREIDRIRPKVILAVGALPIMFFTGAKKSGDFRGSCMWSDTFNCWIVSTWQPTVVWTVSPTLISDIVRDVLKIQYIKDKPKDLGHVNYEVVASAVQAQQILDSDWLRTAQFPSLDVECKWDTDHWTDDIRCLSISDGDVTYTFPEEVLGGLRWPQNAHWTFHNGAFDTQKLILDQGIDLPICDDTMLMSYSLDERGGGGDDEAQGVDIHVGIHGLKRLSREFCGAGFYEVDLKTASDEEVWEYNAKDAAYTARLAKLFYERQLEDDMREFYLRMILPEVRVCRDEKAHGIYVERSKVKALAVTWGEEWLRLNDELVADAYAKGWPDPNFNWNSPIQTVRFMTSYLDLPIANAQAATLENYADHPWVAKRLRVKKLDKQIGTYVTGILHAISDDSRMHPDASIHSTVSGRKTYHNPAIGTIPTGAQYMDPDEAPDEETESEIAEFRQVRGLFGVPKGKVFLEADYKAAEGWVAAGYSRDQNLLNDLQGDWHGDAAEVIFQIKREDYPKDHWSGIRREAKYFNFGLLFWRGPGSFYKPAPGQGGNLGKKYTLPQITVMCNRWHDHYYGHRDWSNKVVREAQVTGEQKNIAGRKRRYHAAGVYGGHFQNMAANWPIQSTAHDHLIVARLELDEMFRHGDFPARSLWDGHDAIYFEVDDQDVDDAVGIIREVMERPRWFDFGLPVEIKAGADWASARELKPSQLWRAS